HGMRAGRARVSERRRDQSRASSARDPGGQGSARRSSPRGLLAVHGRPAGRSAPGESLAERRSAVEGLGTMRRRWAERRVLVTGATCVVGGWLVKALLEQGAYVVALVLDADPQSELYRSGDVGHVSVVNGALEDYGTLDRAIATHAVDSVFHLGAQTLVETAQRAPWLTFEANIRGTYN